MNVRPNINRLIWGIFMFETDWKYVLVVKVVS